MNGREINMKENLKITRGMVKGLIIEKMEINMKENLKITRGMVKGLRLVRMEEKKKCFIWKEIKLGNQ